jgi:putative SOS response-associated peptidase YedK
VCFFYSMSQVAKNLENRYNAPVVKGFSFDPVHYVSGFSFPLMPVVIAAPTAEIRLLRWGLIPSWTHDSEQAGQMRPLTLNARSESVFEKPSFRKSVFSRRCLVPSDGFFEWQTVGDKKIPWFVTAKEPGLFSFGGIWDQWENPGGEPEITFSILTTEANPLMAEIHNSKKRMPLILPPEVEYNWLDPSFPADQIKKLMVPFPESALKAWTISNLITAKGANPNTPDVKKPFSWSQVKPAQGLF